MNATGKTRLKIAIMAQFPAGVLTGEMVGRGGGQAATWLPQLALAWSGEPTLDIHWCILTKDKPAESSIVRWGQTFHFLHEPGITIGLLCGRWPQRLAYRRILRAIQPDLIHVWGTENLFGAAMQEFDGPSILSMQGIIHACFRTGDLRGWRWRLFKHWEPVSLRKASMITSESDWGLARVREIVPDKPTRKIEYGVFPSYHDVTWEPSPDQPEFLYAGGLCRLKGTDILIKMLAEHPRRSWKLVFAGDGYLKESLRGLNDPQVEVLGSITTSELQARMAKAWALVHPSRADTSPNVVKEARVVGLPVIGSPHGGHAEYIEDGVDGFIVKGEDPSSWFRTLDRLAHDFPSCMRMGRIHHEHYRKHFLSGHTATAFAELYHEIAGK